MRLIKHTCSLNFCIILIRLRRSGWVWSMWCDSFSMSNSFGIITGMTGLTVSSTSSTSATSFSLSWVSIRSCSGARSFMRSRFKDSERFCLIRFCSPSLSLTSHSSNTLSAALLPPSILWPHQHQSLLRENVCSCWPYSARPVCCHEHTSCLKQSLKSGEHASWGRARWLNCCHKMLSRCRHFTTSSSWSNFLSSSLCHLQQRQQHQQQKRLMLMWKQRLLQHWHRCTAIKRQRQRKKKSQADCCGRGSLEWWTVKMRGMKMKMEPRSQLRKHQCSHQEVQKASDVR